MNDEVKWPKKSFHVEFTISWVVAGIFGIVSSLLGIFQFKLLALGFGVVGILSFCAAIYFYNTKPKPIAPSISST